MKRNTMKKLILGAAAAFAVVTAGAVPSFMFGDAAMASVAPSVVSITGDTGVLAGGNTVTVTGASNLTDPANPIVAPATTQWPASIYFGTVRAHIVSCVPAPAATCNVIVPPGIRPGVVDVRVTDDGITSPVVVGDNYTYTNVPGPIVGYGARCADDWLSRTTDFNKIDIYTCNGTSAQNWTVAPGVFTHAGGTISLTTLGGCMDVRLSGGANGTLINRYHCNGTGAQLWSAYVHSQLRNPESGKCLTDKGYAINGVQLILSTCKGNPNQRWLLP
jgi:hypothetical protein